MALCRAKAKSTGEPCKQKAMPNGVCRFHGGRTPSGVASPAFQTGRYSRHLPTRMLAEYQASVTDPELLNLREEIAVIDSRIAALLQRVDRGESGRLWRELKSAWRSYKSAGDETDQAIALVEMGRLIDHGHMDTVAWAETADFIERRRKLVESERKRLVEMQQMMTAGQAQLLIARLYDVVTQHVSDRATLAAIGTELQALTGAGATVSPGRGTTDS